jgi:cysteine desulfuration protein SufE
LKTIEQTENEIVDEFAFFTDWQEKYEYIIELGRKLESYPEDKRTDEYKVKGCQSNVWLTAYEKDGRIYFLADSDSSIVRGLVYILLRVLSGRTPDEIINSGLEFIDKIGLRKHLAATRANGLMAMIKQIKMYALAYRAKLHQINQ